LIALVGLLGPMPIQGRVANVTADCLHLPSFAIVTCLAILLTDRFINRSATTRLLTTIFVILASAAIELLQPLMGRTASMKDLVSNSAGALIAFIFFISYTYQTRTKWLLRVAVIAIAIIAWSGPWQSLLDIYDQSRSPDQLAAFSRDAELERWYFESVDVAVVTGRQTSGSGAENCLCVTFYPGKFPALQLQSLTKDWTPYSRLTFELTGASDNAKPIRVRLRIADGKRVEGDLATFIRDFEPSSIGTQMFVIPLDEIAAGTQGRTVDLSRVRFVEFMAIELDEPRRLRLGPIRLLP